MTETGTPPATPTNTETSPQSAANTASPTPTTPRDILIKALNAASLQVVDDEQFTTDDAFSDVLPSWLNIMTAMAVMEPNHQSPTVLFLLGTAQGSGNLYCYAVDTTTSRFVVTTRANLEPRLVKKPVATAPGSILGFIKKEVLVPTVHPISELESAF